MSGGLKTTLHVLAKTNNDAAVGVLIPALDSPLQSIGNGALRNLLLRRSDSGGHELVRRWDSLSDPWKAIIAERPGRIVNAVRDGIVGTETRMCVNGCDALLYIQEYDLMPALINAAENTNSTHSGLTAKTLLRLAELLYHELAGPRDYKNRRDPKLIRQHLVGSLERSVKRFDHHKRKEIIEAFLILTKRDNSTLKRIIQNPHEKSYLVFSDLMTHSHQPGVIRLALSFLDDPHAPLSSVVVNSHREDEVFVKHLLDKIGSNPSPEILANLKRMEAVSWLQGDWDLINSLNEEQQSAVVTLVMESSIQRLKGFEVIRYLAEHGNVAGRQAACDALRHFKGVEANQLLLKSLDDRDPQVQASALRQIRNRGIPGGLARLIDAADSPHQVVREAVQESMAEFNLSRFLAAFDMLDDNVRRSTGTLVKKVDSNAISGLAVELDAQSRSRKLRALEAAPVMGAVADLEQEIIVMLDDDDHFIRAEAANALGESDSPEVQLALRKALLDRAVMVQEAAEASLRQIAETNAARPQQPRSAPPQNKTASPPSQSNTPQQTVEEEPR